MDALIPDCFVKYAMKHLEGPTFAEKILGKSAAVCMLPRKQGRSSLRAFQRVYRVLSPKKGKPVDQAAQDTLRLQFLAENGSAIRVSLMNDVGTTAPDAYRLTWFDVYGKPTVTSQPRGDGSWLEAFRKAIDKAMVEFCTQEVERNNGKRREID